jgi:hypothetical protein
MIKERFTVPSFAFWATEGKQGLRFRVKQKIEIQKPHFLK